MGLFVFHGDKTGDQYEHEEYHTHSIQGSNPIYEPPAGPTTCPRFPPLHSLTCLFFYLVLSLYPYPPYPVFNVFNPPTEFFKQSNGFECRALGHHELSCKHILRGLTQGCIHEREVKFPLHYTRALIRCFSMLPHWQLRPLWRTVYLATHRCRWQVLHTFYFYCQCTANINTLSWQKKVFIW